MIDNFFENPELGACLVFIFITAMLLMFLNEIYFWIKSFSWLEAKGKIIKAKRTDTGFDKEVIIKIVYQYSVKGMEYTSDRIRYLQFNGPAIPSWFDEYRKGMDVTIFYNPNKPSQSILINKFSMVNIIMYLFVCVVLGWMLFKLNCLCNWLATVEYLQSLWINR